MNTDGRAGDISMAKPKSDEAAQHQTAQNPRPGAKPCFSHCVAFARTCLSPGKAETPTSLLPTVILASTQDVLFPDLLPGQVRRNWKENGW